MAVSSSAAMPIPVGGRLGQRPLGVVELAADGRRRPLRRGEAARPAPRPAGLRRSAALRRLAPARLPGRVGEVGGQPAGPAARRCPSPSISSTSTTVRSSSARSWETTTSAPGHSSRKSSRIRSVSRSRSLVGSSSSEDVRLLHEREQQLEPAALAARQRADRRPLRVAVEPEPLHQRRVLPRHLLLAAGDEVAHPDRRVELGRASG